MNPSVVIIGGGFSGVATAVNLAAASPRPLAITIVEPAPVLGRGVAYGTDDPDHRLNGPSNVHFLSLGDTEHFTRWHAESGARDGDPESVVGSAVFPRRRDFAAYLAAEVDAAVTANRSGSSIEHRRSRAVDGSGGRVGLDDGTDLAADLVVITTSNGPPGIPAGLGGIVGAPGFIADPWADGATDAVPESGRVLMIGTGLTMADQVVTLQRDRPEVEITAISRRGLLPRSLPTTSRGLNMIDVLTTRAPAFLERHHDVSSTRRALRVVREEIAALTAAGEEWHAAFDELRDAAHVLWPRLPGAEQARFARHLAAWYEVHRFRFPPPTERVIGSALQSGALVTEAARVVHSSRNGAGLEVERRRRTCGESLTERFDAVVNCTGPERSPRRAGDPFLTSLAEAGTIVPHPLGMGIVVDEHSQAIACDERADPQLRVVGPLARGRFGECMGVPHIVARLADVMPSMIRLTEESR